MQEKGDINFTLLVTKVGERGSKRGDRGVMLVFLDVTICGLPQASGRAQTSESQNLSFFEWAG